MRWLCYGSRNIWKGENKLKTEILSQEKNVVEAKAQFTAEEVNKAIENTYKDISKKANIKGFRKGKVLKCIKSLYVSVKNNPSYIIDKVKHNLLRMK